VSAVRFCLWAPQNSRKNLHGSETYNPHPMTLRVVFDTNVVLSLFAFTNSRFAPLRTAINDQRIHGLTRDDCLAELQRVLQSSSLTLSDRARHEAYVSYVSKVQCIEAVSANTVTLPRCRDSDDQKFLEVARDGGAHYLVTLDGALLGVGPAMTRATGVRVVVPRRLMAEAFVVV
jgi:uncharacterized protein